MKQKTDPKAYPVPHHSEETSEMDEYGITRTTVDVFHYRDFKYASLRDALAQARRDKQVLG